MCETEWTGCQRQAYPLPGLTIKSHKSSVCQGRSRVAVHSQSEAMLRFVNAALTGQKDLVAKGY